MATVAVFIALGGASYAATQLPKNSVGTKQLKKNAVTGAKVKEGSLTGADIDASSLGSVPSASHANSAGDAAALQGHPASDFLGANAEATDSAKLEGLSGREFGAVMSGGIQNVPTLGPDNSREISSPASGVAQFENQTTHYGSLSPDTPLIAHNLSVRVLTAPGIGNRVFANLEINGTVIESFGCEISDTQTGCTDSVDTVPIPAGSWMEMSLNQLTETPVFPVEAVMTGFQLSK